MVKDDAYYLNTIPGRLEVRWTLFLLKVVGFPWHFWFWLGFRLPRKLAHAAFIRVAAETMDGQEDLEAYGRMCKRWKGGV